MAEVSTEPLHIKTSEIIAEKGEGPWYEPLFSDGRNNTGLICDLPGTASDHHWHPDFDEFWVVMRGTIDFDIGDYPTIHASKGDIVSAPAGKRHQMMTVGDESSVRLHISKIGSNHDNKNDRSSAIEPFPDQTEPPNMLLSSKEALLESFGEPPWATSLLDDERNKANLIGHSQGMTNNAHWHPDFNEWWTILQGDLTFQVGEDRALIEATQGDIVFVPEGMKHFISSVGEGTSLRLAVTNSENQHIYTADDDSAPPPIS